MSTDATPPPPPVCMPIELDRQLKSTQTIQSVQQKKNDDEAKNKNTE